MTNAEYRVAILDIMMELYPGGDQEQWLLTPQTALDGDTPMQALEKGKEKDVYELLLRTKKGN